MVNYCYISSQEIYLNGQLLTNIEEDVTLKNHYKYIAIDYPKFYKMDNLSKLSFIGWNLLKKELALTNYKDDEIHLIFANQTASTDTDLKFVESYENGNPSPSLFVYTLPNILTGELAIFEKWFGENCFFISESFNSELFEEQIKFALDKGAKACLVGWIEKSGNKNEAFMAFTDKVLSKNEIELMYKKG